jgi:hypothetical protein
MRRSLAAVCVVLCTAVVSFGQPSVAQLESRLVASSGAERGRLLTELTGRLNNDNPPKRAGANGWVSVTARTGATPGQLGHPEDSGRWIADGLVAIETSTRH